MTAHDIRGRPLFSPQCGPSLNALKSLLQHMLPPTQLLLPHMRGHSQMRAVMGPRLRSGKCGVMYHTYSSHARVEWRSLA